MNILSKIEEIAGRAEHAASAEAQSLWAAIQRECGDAEAHLAEFEQAATNLIHSLEQRIMSSLDDLKAQVAQSNSVIDSASQLIAGLKAKLDAAIAAAKAGDDHAALDQLSADLAAHTSALAGAVTANTVVDPVPADPTPEAPAPTPEPTPAPVEQPAA